MSVIQEEISKCLKEYKNNNVIRKNEQCITYSDLEKKSNIVAGIIQSMDIESQSVIGILMEDKAEIIAIIIGILKERCAFMPLEPTYPIKRLETMIHKAEPKAIFIDERGFNLLTRIQANDCKTIKINESVYNERECAIEGEVKAEYEENDMVYIYFTSGTTGEPKAIAGANKGLLQFINWERTTFHIDSSVHVSQFTSPCHDPYLRDIFLPLLSGGMICIPDSKEVILDPNSLKHWIEQEEINLIHCTPSLFRVINSEGLKSENYCKLKHIFLAGEKVNPQELKKWYDVFGERIKFINLYGPTETTMAKVYYEISPADAITRSIPIGKPIDGARVIILNEQMKICSQGEIGELYIRTPYRTLGYYKDEALTKENFVQNMFSSIQGDLIYKTGDYGRLLPNKNIELVGRIDRQIKIRGFRVELDEIEKCILDYPGIRMCVVDYNKKENLEEDGYICAYCVFDKHVEMVELRCYLEKILPEYMMPSYFMELDKIPLNQNGKIDYQALPKHFSSIEKKKEPPRNSIERKLVEIWREILEVQNIGINDNFFKIGGHSLKLMKLISIIYSEFKVEISLGDIFDHPTIARIAEDISLNMKTEIPMIEKVTEREYYPLSSTQKRMFIMNQLEQESTLYNLPGALEFKGNVQLGKLEEAFRKLICRHEAFRTSFGIENGEPVQYINPCAKFDIVYLDLKQVELKNNRIVHEIKEFIQPFDLRKYPLLRVLLIEIKEDEHILVYDMHHIISDGISIDILEKEFVEIYCDHELSNLKISYKDYACWQYERCNQKSFKLQEEFWLNMFSGEIPVLNLPTDHPRPMVYNYAGNRVNFIISKHQLEGVKKLAITTSKTMNMILLSVYYIFLYKYTGQEDIVIGSPIAGRPLSELENIIGMFANTLALRNYPIGELSFSDFLTEVSKTLMKAYENQEYPFENLVDELNIMRDLSHNPIIDTLFSFKNYETKRLEIPELTIQPYQFGTKITKYDLSLYMVEEKDELRCYFEYNTALFKKETILRMTQHYMNILDQVVNNVNLVLKKIDMITKEEKSQILYEFNDTQSTYPANKLLHKIFEEQVAKNENKCCVYFNGSTLTYHELNSRANQLARVLAKNGAEPGKIIGIFTDRSIEMIVGIMAILKSGAAYLPINTQYPEERIVFMIEDSKVNLLLIEKRTKEVCDTFSFYHGEVIFLDDQTLYQGDDSNLDLLDTPSNLAYIIYTSGSTGKPKGVMIEHHSVVNRLHWMQKQYSLTCDDIILQKTPFSFDVSVWELFLWFFAGASVCFLTPGGEKDPSVICKAINEYKITIMHFVPSMLNAFLGYYEENSSIDDLSSLRCVFTSGEALTLAQAKRFNAALNVRYGTKLHNLYGPTEATVDVSYFDCSGADNLELIPIGKPIDNIKLYVLDSGEQLVPIGVYGELYISGVGVARGYINNLELTKEKFKPDTFDYGKTMYRTGDIVRWLPDGNIDYLGRRDDQVKIRGVRIELNEIQVCLQECEFISDSAVIVEVGADGEKQICAYIVYKESCSVNSVRRYLKEKLPSAMFPSFLYKVDQIPHNANGKVDKKALMLKHGEDNSQREYEVPQNSTEVVLMEIWKQILKPDMQIDRNSNFFESGGHSLKAITLVAEIHSRLNIRIPLIDVFKNPTIKQLANCIRKSNTTIYTAIERATEKDYYPTSAAQKRIYILSNMEKNQTNYNMHKVTIIEGSLNISIVKRIFLQLTKRHETLRTSFELLQGELVQRVMPDIEPDVSYVELKENSSEVYLQEVIQQFIKPFALEKAPLLRVCLIKLAEHKHVLVYDMHHIISDGASVEILAREFNDIYHGVNLRPLGIQYKDYVVWQEKRNNQANIEDSVKYEKYWLKQLSDDLPLLNLATDYPRSLTKSFEGDSISFRIDEELTNKLYRIATNSGMTLYIVLLSAYNVLLSKYTGQDDICVGCPVSGRYHSELDNIIGMFVNTIVLRNKLSGDMRYIDFLDAVKQCCIEGYENQEYQFEKLVDKLDVQRDPGRNPIFDTMLVLQNFQDESITAKDLRYLPYNLPSTISKLDITLYAVAHDQTIEFELEYCTKLFSKDSINRMVVHFINILKEIACNQEKKIADINMLLEEEKNTLLYDFNNTAIHYDQVMTIHQLIEAQVDRNPEQIVFVFKNKTMTYREMNERANQLARQFRKKGVKRDSIVAIMCERSIEMMVGIVAILKAGGGYLPLDPGYPEERILYMLEDSKAALLLTQRHRGNISEQITDKKNVVSGIDTLYLDDSDLYEGDASNLEGINKVDDIAYVIYTSGSTGKPKGVVIEHKEVYNFIQGITNIIEFDESKIILALTTMSFDIFVLETLLPLCEGVQIVIADESEQRNVKLLDEIIVKNHVNMLQITPSRMQLLLKSGYVTGLKNLTTIMVGGEAFPNSMKDALQELTNARIYNMYGPTETTVWSTVAELTKADQITIGKPIANTQIYILDKYNNFVPFGVPGELCIAGDGLARGYLNRPELTKSKFLQNPFDKNTRLYKTGDLAKWQRDGKIICLGRLDSQVKIRGFRLELGEIEKVTRNYQEVNDCVVLVKEDEEGAKRLVAYYTAEKEIVVLELRAYLLSQLPDYMCPEYFVYLKKLPLTPNGKLNRKALPQINSSNVGFSNHIAEPKTMVEEQLLQIWRKILKNNNIDTEDSFFEAGGNSMLLIYMHSEVEKKFPVKINVADVFAYPTIKSLATFIEQARSPKIDQIVLPSIPMPDRFFIRTGEVEDDISIKFQIDVDVYSKLQTYCTGSKHQVTDILLGIYIYLIYSISKRNHLAVCSIKQEQLISIDVDFDKVNVFSALFDMIEEKERDINELQSYKVEDLKKVKVANIDNHMRFLFLSQNYSEEVKNNFDVIFILDEKNNGTVTCMFNNQRIKSDEVHEFICNYIALIENFLTD